MMATQKPIFSTETFKFFKALGRNNHKDWMAENRDRYQATVMQPFRRLLEELTPAALDLDSRFDTSGRTGTNFSRINNDIRFSKDKTLYKTNMYLKLSIPWPGEGETGQLFAGLSKDSVTAGFRIYSGSKRKESTLAIIGEPRAMGNPRFVAQQKKRLSRRYESYWYVSEKGQWTQRDGWPTEAEDWKKIRAWIVRRKLKLTAATRADFPREVAKIFREVYPLLRFTSLQD